MTSTRKQRVDRLDSTTHVSPALRGSVHARLYHIASQISDPALVRSELRKMLIAETGAIASAHVSRSPQDEWPLLAESISGDLPKDEDLRGQLVELCRSTVERSKPQVQQARGMVSLFLIASPVLLPRTQPDVLLAVVPAQAGAVHAASLMVDLVASYQKTWALTHITGQLDRQLDAIAALCELTSKVAGAGDLNLAATRLVNEVQRRLGCQRVALGLVRGRSLQLAAVSGTSVMDSTSVPVHRLTQAMQETLYRGETSAWSSSDRQSRLLAHQQLGQHCSFPAVISVRLVLASGEVVGVWLVAGAMNALQAPETLRFMNAAAPHLAIALDVCRRAEPGVISRCLRGIQRGVRTRTGVAVLVGLLLTCGALWIPVPSSVRCDCRVAPISRRYVVAPFDGQLEAVLVQRGDTVAAGQLMARMDGRQVRWELAGVESERHQAARRHEVELVGQNVPEAILARLELERLNAKEAQLTHREQQLEILSQVSGVVLEGLRDRVDGTPVKTGEVLFEVAPLDRVRVEIEIPSEDVSAICRGQAATLWLEGQGGEALTGQLASLAPESEVSEGANVFIGEMEFANSEGKLRPGMRGRAKIETTRRRLGMILFRPLWEWILSHWG